MKQHITKEQWKELDDEQQKELLKWKTKADVSGGLKVWFEMTIGQMIEFLGDDLKEIKHIPDGNLIRLGEDGEDQVYFITTKINLCDALWSACKEKLK